MNDQTRILLTLELAIVLPAAALMGFSILNAKHIHRDFSYVLKIAEKQSGDKARELVATARKECPCPEIEHWSAWGGLFTGHRAVQTRG